ncbi:MAG: DISARM system SNF2-like helicase DrmD [Methanomassiliicoccales archaeon]
MKEDDNCTPVILTPRSPIEPGNLVHVRGRHGLVESAMLSECGSGPTLATIKYLDQYQPSEETIVWEMEPNKSILDARMIPEISKTPPTAGEIYYAYMNSLIWSSKLAFPRENLIFLTGPIWSSVLIHRYQLWPAYKAMLMPSVRLFIADDVGLGKTVEAGLVMQELIAQRSIRRILIICPASLQRQWQDEMREKFHQNFIIMDRDEISRIKQLDPNANPWATHQKIIVSMDFLKRREIIEEFISGSVKFVPKGSGRFPWDLLIVDEVHNFAPLPGCQSTERIRMLESIIGYFEHRIFLSATPHNGFHYSYTGLLNLLDPVRFQKSISPSADDEAHIRAVFIRRLKEDVNRDDPPKKFEIRDPPIALRSQPSEIEQRLFAALREYDRALRNFKCESDREKQALNFIRSIFRKRLLSSPYAFARTWYAHISRIKGIKIDFAQRDLYGKERIITVLNKLKSDAEADMSDDMAREDIERDAATLSGQLLSQFWNNLEPIAEEITHLLNDEMKMPFDKVLAGSLDYKFEFPDSKFDKLLRWMKDYLQFDGSNIKSEERVIIFTEYCDTQAYINKRLIDSGIPAETIMIVNGRTDPQRVEMIKEEFNDPNAKVRILLATDAAREGLNLQQTCRYIIHHDLPWNPLRIDQRIGRVDRHGQTRKVSVWHHLIETIEEYDFLSYIARKVEEARNDLGGLSPVLEETVESFFLSGDPQQDLNDAKGKIDGVLKSRKIPCAGDRPNYTVIESIEENTRLQLGIDEERMRFLLESAIRLDGGALEPTHEKEVYSIRLPQSWHFLSDSLRNPNTKAMKKITFRRSLLVKDENEMKKWVQRGDLVLINLGHPLMRYAIERLRRYVWHQYGNSPSPVTKWTLDVESERSTRAIVSILEIARNAKGEVVHEEVKHLAYDHKSKSFESVSHFKKIERSCDGSPPAWYKELLERLGSQIEGEKEAFEQKIRDMLKDRMNKDMAFYLECKERSLRMLEESAREASREEIRKLEEEVQHLEEEKKQRRLDPIIETDIRLKLEQKKFELRELKERATEAALLKQKEHIEAEANRYIEEIFPSRYTLDRADVIVAGILFTGE